jgi:hypothetical protein
MPVQIAASGGSIQWAGRFRAASGNGISFLCRVFIPTAATADSISFQFNGDPGGTIQIIVDHAGTVQVYVSNGGERTTDYSTTIPVGRWVWLAVRIPANFFSGGAVDASAWYDNNGTWTALSVSATSADPGGSLPNTSGDVAIYNNMDGNSLLGPAYGWAGADAPDTAAEFRAIALGTADPAAYTGLIFAAELTGTATDTWGTDVAASVETGVAFVTSPGLPDTIRLICHTLRDYNFSDLPVGAAAAVTNLALTGGDLATAASMTAADVVDNPYGVRAAYMGAQEGGAGNNRALDSAANGPIIRNDYVTIVVVGGTWHGADGSTVNTLLDTGSTDLRLDMLNLNRLGLNANTTDALHRVPSTPHVEVIRLAVATPVDHWIGNDGLQSHASFVCGSGTRESQTFRIGGALGTTSTNTRFWYQRVIVFEGAISDTHIAEIIASLGDYHNCRHYTAGRSNLLTGEGTSSFAGTWDHNNKGGAFHRFASQAPPTTIVYSFPTSGHTMTEILVSDDTTVRYVSETLHPGALKKTMATQFARNDAEAGTASATIITNIETFAAANTPYYDRWIAFEAHPSWFSASQAARATVLEEVNAALYTIAGVDRVVPSYFRNWGVGGDWSNNPDNYVESPSGIHLDSGGHDVSWANAWARYAQAEFSDGGERVNRVTRVVRSQRA